MSLSRSTIIHRSSLVRSLMRPMSFFVTLYLKKTRKSSDTEKLIEDLTHGMKLMMSCIIGDAKSSSCVELSKPSVTSCAKQGSRSETGTGPVRWPITSLVLANCVRKWLARKSHRERCQMKFMKRQKERSSAEDSNSSKQDALPDPYMQSISIQLI